MKKEGHNNQGYALHMRDIGIHGLVELNILRKSWRWRASLSHSVYFRSLGPALEWKVGMNQLVFFSIDFTPVCKENNQAHCG